MSIVLFGADGQWGFELQRSLSALYDVHACTRSGRLSGGFAGECVDFAEPGQAAALIRRLQPRAVVNAAAYTAVDRAADAAQLAQRHNAHAVADTAIAFSHRCSKMRHYSHHYIFSCTPNRSMRDNPDPG